jgi:hypothetical protein
LSRLIYLFMPLFLSSPTVPSPGIVAEQPVVRANIYEWAAAVWMTNIDGVRYMYAATGYRQYEGNRVKTFGFVGRDRCQGGDRTIRGKATRIRGEQFKFAALWDGADLRFQSNHVTWKAVSLPYPVVDPFINPPTSGGADASVDRDAKASGTALDHRFSRSDRSILCFLSRGAFAYVLPTSGGNLHATVDPRGRARFQFTRG